MTLQKRTYKKTALVAALALGLVTGAAQAKVSLSAGYTNLSSDDDNIDVSVSALTAGIGYTVMSQSKQWSLMPELRAGFGIGDDSVNIFGTRADVELSRYLSASIRGSYYLSDTISIYLQPAYTNIELEVSAFGESASDDEWEFGVGGGISAQISDSLSVEAQYERYSDANIISANLRLTY